MAKAVKDLPKEIQDLIEVHEWDMRTREGFQMFKDLKGKFLPSIAIERQLIYEALIPGQEELSEEILKRYREKNI